MVANEFDKTVDVLIRDVFVSAVLAVQPDDLFNAEVGIEVGFNFTFSEIWISVFPRDGGASGHEGSLSIHFDGTAFQNHGTQVNDRDADVLCNCERNSIVQGEGRVPTPAVESPIQDDPFVICTLDENRAVVPNPKVVGWAQQKIDLA